MYIVLFLALMSFLKSATAKFEEGRPRSIADPDDPRSAKSILDKIYGPPVDTDVDEKITLLEEQTMTKEQRVSSAQYPMIVAVYVYKVNKEDKTDIYEEFRGGGVIVTAKVVISKCSSFFTVTNNSQLIRIEDLKEDLMFDYPLYSVHAGHFFIPNMTSSSKPQVNVVRATHAHPECAIYFKTAQKYNYDSVALELLKPLMFDQYVRPAAFYSLNYEDMEDRIEENQEINFRCKLMVPTEDGELYAGLVQMLGDDECNNLLCMIGFMYGDICRKPYTFFDVGVFCTLRASGDIPCNFKDGVLLCDNQVFGFPIEGMCRVCSPLFIAKPTPMIDLARMFVERTEDLGDTTEDKKIFSEEFEDDGIQGTAANTKEPGGNEEPNDTIEESVGNEESDRNEELDSGSMEKPDDDSAVEPEVDSSQSTNDIEEAVGIGKRWVRRKTFLHSANTSKPS